MEKITLLKKKKPRSEEENNENGDFRPKNHPFSLTVMINDTTKKYEIKEKHKIYVETLARKNHGQRRKLYYQFERNSKYN